MVLICRFDGRRDGGGDTGGIFTCPRRRRRRRSPSALAFVAAERTIQIVAKSDVATRFVDVVLHCIMGNRRVDQGLQKNASAAVAVMLCNTLLTNELGFLLILFCTPFFDFV